MPITTLPDDILLHVFDHLSQEGRFQLLQVCRHWYSLFFSAAWRKLNLDDENIYPLVCCIQQNPKLGPAIRDLRVDWGLWGDESVHDIGMFKGLVEQASHSSEHAEEWEKALREGSPDAWLALLVPSLESVTMLYLVARHESTYFTPMVARAASREKPFDLKPVLQNLEHVILATEDNTKSHYPADDFLSFFSFPAMQSFSGNAICEDGPCMYEGYQRPAPGTSGIKTLDFGSFGPCNGENGMADFITSCESLESFEYQHSDQAIWSESYIPFLPLAFHTALLTQKHSLREIRLNNAGELSGASDYDEGIEPNKFGSLAGFDQLQELRMPWVTLLQVNSDDQPTVSLEEILPVSLEYLSLSHCRAKDFTQVIKCLQGVLEHRKERFPNIKTLVVGTDVERVPGTYGWHESCFRIPQSTIDTFAPLEMACREMWIQLRFCKSA